MAVPRTRLFVLGRETHYVVAMTLAFAMLGIWQHLYFSHAVGELAFFKNAFDEDTYVLNLNPALFIGLRPDRLLSSTIALALFALSGSRGFVLIALDAIMPPLIFLSAYYAAGALFRDTLARGLVALLMVFAQDLLSLGNVAAYPGPFPTLSHLQALVGPALVPPIETSFLAIYRSPEPQVAYAVGFALAGIILRGFLAGQLTRRQSVAIILLQVAAAISYALVSYPMFAIEGAAGLVLLVRRRRSLGLLLVGLAIASVGLAVVSARLAFGSAGTGTFAFSSRLPTATVSALLAMPLTSALCVCALLDARHRDRLVLAAMIALLPLVITNQQIITGTMISTKEWERYITLTLIMLAAGLGLSAFGWAHRLPRPAILLATAAVAAFVAVTSQRTYRFWLPDNLKSVAIARAILAANPTPGTRLVVDDPGYVPFVETRLGHPIHSVLDITAVFTHPIPPSPEFVETDHAKALFEYWKLRKVAPRDAEAILLQEAATKNGFFSGFLFNYCEFWAPCTDGRAVKTEKIRSQIPQVVAAYSAYEPPPDRIAFVTLGKHAGRSLGTGAAGPFVATVFAPCAADPAASEAAGCPPLR